MLHAYALRIVTFNLTRPTLETIGYRNNSTNEYKEKQICHNAQLRAISISYKRIVFFLLETRALKWQEKDIKIQCSLKIIIYFTYW